MGINFILAEMSEEFNNLIDAYQTHVKIDYQLMKDLSVKIATHAHLIVFEINLELNKEGD